MEIKDINPAGLATVLEERGLENLDELMAEIGLGNQMASIIVRRLVSDTEDLDKVAEQGPLAIKGTEGLVVTYARCCRPIPGDPIIGHVSAGRGIVVHTDSCKNMAELREKPDEIMEVRWDPEVEQESPLS